MQYLGIAADEPERIARHQQKENIRLPLVEIGWDEAYCRQWCEENDLLSPIYTTATRGGCWFCHNQGVDQLRLQSRAVVIIRIDLVCSVGAEKKTNALPMLMLNLFTIRGIRKKLKNRLSYFVVEAVAKQRLCLKNSVPN